MWDSISGTRDYDLSRRQMLNQLSHPGVPQSSCFKKNAFMEVSFSIIFGELKKKQK